MPSLLPVFLPIPFNKLSSLEHMFTEDIRVRIQEATLRFKIISLRKICFDFKQPLKVVATSSTVGNLTKEAVKLMQAKVELRARSVGV